MQGLPSVNPLSLLLSGLGEKGDVNQVIVKDCGSRPLLARVSIHGVSADGVVDTAAGITIIGGKVFALLAASARLRKRNLKPSDKVPRTYDQKVFHLDGRMEIEISFEGKVMKTTVHIKIDAPDQLLLSEGVCKQLGIINYYPSQLSLGIPETTANYKKPGLVPSIRVCLLQSLRLPQGKTAVVSVQAETQQHPTSRPY